jgi:hypothetical protein
MLSAQPLPHRLPPLNGAGNKARAIVSTLIYYDLFAFPPSAAELVRFAHCAGGDGHFSQHDLTEESAWWSSRGGYWFLRGREQLIAYRTESAQTSAHKLTQARRWARLLQVVPGVRFIGVTGSLSMDSAAADDDIDFLVITARGRLWLTRALVLAVLWALRVKRADDGRTEHPDLVCANIFLQEDDLEIRDHNIFIAHEVCQMLPLLGPAAYHRLVRANAWVSEYLPQWDPPTAVWEDNRALRLAQRACELALGSPVGALLEREVARRQMSRIRQKHARGHNVGVKLSPTQLRFHPRDLSRDVVDAFDARWNSLQSGDESPRGAEALGGLEAGRTYR